MKRINMQNVRSILPNAYMFKCYYFPRYNRYFIQNYSNLNQVVAIKLDPNKSFAKTLAEGLHVKNIIKKDIKTKNLIWFLNHTDGKNLSYRDF